MLLFVIMKKNIKVLFLIIFFNNWLCMNFKIKFYYEEKGIFLNFWLWWKYGKIDIINVVYILKIVVLEK